MVLHGCALGGSVNVAPPPQRLNSFAITTSTHGPLIGATHLPHWFISIFSFSPWGPVTWSPEVGIASNLAVHDPNGEPIRVLYLPPVKLPKIILVNTGQW